MSSKSISARKAVEKWQADLAFQHAYADLEEEFSLAAEIIAARARAGLTQSELASRMGTSQSAIARLESGRAHPSITVLTKLAAATGAKLRVSFIS